jgi:hypothetical protein
MEKVAMLWKKSFPIIKYYSIDESGELLTSLVHVPKG